MMASAAAAWSVAPGAPASDARARLDRFLRRPRGLVRWDPRRVRVEPLVQEAGERVYFRVRPAPEAAGAPESASVVVCVMSEAYPPGGLPFANSTLLYRELGVAAPRILEEEPAIGVLALEDLGDDLLQTVVLRGAPEAAAHYGEAVDIVANIQRGGARLAPSASRYRAFSQRLDAPLFLRELRFFTRHFLGGAAGRPPAGPAARELDERFRALAEEAAGGSPVLTHRDFHSRNLIAVPRWGKEPSRLHVIDHQDSRLGPRGYDLMSLVRDPYVAEEAARRLIPPEDDLVARFRESAGLAGSAEELRSELDAVALQRHLKALGTYGFQIFERRNEVYRRYVGPTLGEVLVNLDRHHERGDRRRLRVLLGDLAPPPP